MSDVSVLLPVRDAQATLSEALDSVLAQTHADIDVHIHDDGSTDESVGLLDAAAQTDARIQLTRGDASGIVAALNTAAASASSPWLLRMDADDVCDPTRVASLLAAARAQPEVTFWASGIAYFPREDLSNGMLRYETWINSVRTHDEILRDRFVECPMPHPAWMVRRDLFESLGGYREGGFPEDYDFVLRAAAHGAIFGKVPEVLLQWRDHPARLSRTSPRFELDAFRLCKVETLLPLLRERPIAVLGADRNGKRWSRLLRDHGIQTNAYYARRAGRVGQAIDRIPVHSADALPPPGEHVVLNTIGRGRNAARNALTALGYRELDSFFCVQ